MPQFAPPVTTLVDNTRVEEHDVSRAAVPPPPDGKLQIVFIGTGCSSATPHLHCLLGTRKQNAGPCAVCAAALEGDPAENRNYRLNPSLLIRVRGGEDNDATQHILIDAGKTFREAAQRWFPRWMRGSGGLDAVVITHEHADAILGIDDLRSVQKSTSEGKKRSLPVFLSAQCYHHVANVFPYLQPQGSPENKRMFIADLRWHVLDNRLHLHGLGLQDEDHWTSPPPLVPFSPVPGFMIDAFPVEHGPNFLSLGFAWGPLSSRTVYISDVSKVPPAILEAMRPASTSSPGKDNYGWSIDTLIVDCLDPGPDMYPSHFSLPQTLDLVKELKPKRSLFVGMSHRFEHHMANKELALLKTKIGLDVQLAYDGQCITVAA